MKLLEAGSSGGLNASVGQEDEHLAVGHAGFHQRGLRVLFVSLRIEDYLGAFKGFRIVGLQVAHLDQGVQGHRGWQGLPALSNVLAVMCQRGDEAGSVNRVGLPPHGLKQDDQGDTDEGDGCNNPQADPQIARSLFGSGRSAPFIGRDVLLRDSKLNSATSAVDKILGPKGSLCRTARGWELRVWGPGPEAVGLRDHEREVGGNTACRERLGSQVVAVG